MYPPVNGRLSSKIMATASTDKGPAEIGARGVRTVKDGASPASGGDGFVPLSRRRRGRGGIRRHGDIRASAGRSDRRSVVIAPLKSPHLPAARRASCNSPCYLLRNSVRSRTMRENRSIDIHGSNGELVVPPTPRRSAKPCGIRNARFPVARHHYVRNLNVDTVMRYSYCRLIDAGAAVAAEPTTPSLCAYPRAGTPTFIRQGR